jgi:hypothetical protein
MAESHEKFFKPKGKARRPGAWAPGRKKALAKLIEQGKVKGIRLSADESRLVFSGSEGEALHSALLFFKARKCTPGEKGLATKLKGHMPESSAYPLAKWMIKRGRGLKKKKVA